jgi:hypothetical protein
MNAPIDHADPHRAGYSYGFGSPAHRPRSFVPSAVRHRHRRLALADACYLTIALSGWLATTMLATMGLFVMLFLLVGNGDLIGMFEQIDQFARHYIAADPATRGPFDARLRIVLAAVFGITAVFRGGSLVAVFKGGLRGSRHDDHG